MNYIGSKQRLLSFLHEHIYKITNLSSGVFIDAFAGTGAVGKSFAEKGFSVIANDLQYYSYCINRGKLAHPIDTNKMQKIINMLNALPEISGFIFENYTEHGSAGRLYFSESNGKKADSIRTELENLKLQEDITEEEYFYLLYCVLEAIDSVANTASVYGAFLKKLKKSAQKKLIITPLPFFEGSHSTQVFQKKIEDLVPKITGDILYLDPPYNARQYAPNYHVLETIAKYDNPEVYGKTGLRKYEEQKSDFCILKKVLGAFEHIVASAQVSYIFLSYNNEGIMKPEEIQSILQKYGNTGVFTKSYTRFKADKTEKRNHIANSTTEYLYWLKK